MSFAERLWDLANRPSDVVFDVFFGTLDRVVHIMHNGVTHQQRGTTS